MDFNVLKIEEYAKKLEVGKSTVWAWKDKGVLKPGRHYIQRGKLVRFIWARDLILELHNDVSKDESKDEPGEDELKEVVTPQPIRRKSQPGINLDY